MTTQLLKLLVNDDERLIPCTGLASLADALRDELHITSVKIGCSEGYCGSCTVLVDNEPVLACLTPAMTCEGKTIRTVDAPGSLADIQEALQQQLCDLDAVQCGMCTPGIVTVMSALIANGQVRNRSDIPDALVGSICRCSGYSRIVDAIDHVLGEYASSGTRDGAS